MTTNKDSVSLNEALEEIRIVFPLRDQDIAEIFNRSLRTVRKWIKSNKLPPGDIKSKMFKITMLSRDCKYHNVTFCDYSMRNKIYYHKSVFELLHHLDDPLTYGKERILFIGKRLNLRSKILNFSVS